MRNVSGWVIAGVICLILITLAVTGIVSFGTPPTTTPTSSQAFVNFANDGLTKLSSTMQNVPLRMVA